MKSTYCLTIQRSEVSSGLQHESCYKSLEQSSKQVASIEKTSGSRHSNSEAKLLSRKSGLCPLVIICPLHLLGKLWPMYGMAVDSGFFPRVNFSEIVVHVRHPPGNAIKASVQWGKLGCEVC